MRAGTVKPGQTNSATLLEIDKSTPQKGEVLVKILEVGIDGTDIEINQGNYGEAPSGEDFLILGHEAVGEVEETIGTNFKEGDLVIPLVRRPGKCKNCSRGQSDMCLDGDYKECGIKGSHGFLREYFVEEPIFLIKAPPEIRHIAVLTEPVSVVTKGVSRAVELRGHSASPINTSLVLGAGSLGLLATALLRLQGYNTHTLDIMPKSSLKAQLVEELGATYIDGREVEITDLPQEIGNLDLVIEATGNSVVTFQTMSALGANGVLCLMGVSTHEKVLEIPADNLIMQMVLGNKTVFGSVSSGRSHYERALGVLGAMEKNWPGWLSKLITRRLPLAEFDKALEPSSDGIKTVVEIT